MLRAWHLGYAPYFPLGYRWVTLALKSIPIHYLVTLVPQLSCGVASRNLEDFDTLISRSAPRADMSRARDALRVLREHRYLD